MSTFDKIASGLLKAALLVGLGGLTALLPSLILWWVWSTEIVGILWVGAPTFEYWSVFKLVWFITTMTGVLGTRK